jgi:hypothetical protein
MTNKRQKIAFCFLIFFSFLPSCGITNENKLITNDKLLNGNFEQGLEVGWQTLAKDYDGSNTVTRAGENKNHYAYLKKVWCGYARLFQIANLSSLDQELSVRLRLNARSNREDYSALAAFVLSYLNDKNEVLAETRIAYSTNDLSNTPTLHIISVKPSEWKTYNLNLKEEIANQFPKIDIAKTKKLKISLYASNDQTSGC